MKTLTDKELAWFKPDPNQPRKEFGLAELTQLEESLFVRQDIPLIAFRDGTIQDGERRWRAAQLKGRIKTLAVVITDEDMTPAELRVFQITSSVHRASLTAHEMWQACVDLLAINSTWKNQDLATHLQMDAASVTRYLSPSKCSKEWQDGLKAGTVGISDCYEASKLPEESQKELLALKRSGASRNAIALAGRKARNGNGDSVKVPSIKIALPGEISVVVKGESIDLESAVEALVAAGKQIKAAIADSLDAVTAQRAWACKAKAGA